MFTGIIQAVSPVLLAEKHEDEWKIQVQRPVSFSDLKTGDSVAVNGVCLTIEFLTDKILCFHLGHETLNITRWGQKDLTGQPMNLETALRAGDFIGGHLVTGHVDGLAKVLKIVKKSHSWVVNIQIPVEFQKYFWKKAFISLNGVSLTVNESQGDILSLCLVPETLKQSNLKTLRSQDLATFEVDSQAHALISHLQNIQPLNS